MFSARELVNGHQERFRKNACEVVLWEEYTKYHVRAYNLHRDTPITWKVFHTLREARAEYKRQCNAAKGRRQ